MSKEFEEIVLEKLCNLEVGVSNLEVDMKDTKQRLGNLETDMKDTKQRLGNLEMELKDTQEVVTYLNQNFTKFDYEINKKIDTLFDAITANNEKHEFYEENIASLNAKTFNHDIIISTLEDKVLAA